MTLMIVFKAIVCFLHLACAVDLQTLEPSVTTSKITNVPSVLPSSLPTRSPSQAPSTSPTIATSSIPIDTSAAPVTSAPTLATSAAPISTNFPSNSPSIFPSSLPSNSPTTFPSKIPTVVPTAIPFVFPSVTLIKSKAPVKGPTVKPTAAPTLSLEPTSQHSVHTTRLPTYLNSRYDSNFLVQQDILNAKLFSPTVWTEVVARILGLASTTQVVILSSSAITLSNPTTHSWLRNRYLLRSAASTRTKPSIRVLYYVYFNIGGSETSASLEAQLTESVLKGSFSATVNLLSQSYSYVGFQNSTILAPSYISQSGPATSSDNNSGSGSNILVICGAVAGVAVLICVIGASMYMYSRSTSNQNLKFEKYNNDSIGSDNDGSIRANKEKGSHGSAKNVLKRGVSTKQTVSNDTRNRCSTNHSMRTAKEFSSSLSKDPASDVEVPILDWNDFELNGNTLDTTIVGRGSFGIVVRARFRPPLPHNVPAKNDIVIKVILSTATGISATDKQIEKNLKHAVAEIRMMMLAEQKMFYKPCIVRSYGVVFGLLPSNLRQVVNIYEEVQVVGLVMNYEGGGTLKDKIHGPIQSPTYSDSGSLHSPHSKRNAIKMSNSAEVTLSTVRKLKILEEVARGIAELHSAGIVHGDIKPENVLLSSDDPVEARLADFGLAASRSNCQFQSTLAETKHFKGTPIYSAPEMLVNPFSSNNDESNGKVARTSRKTDMYAFSVLCWEVLTESIPFSEIKNEVLLSTRVHQGYRPPLDQLPSECTPALIDMIQACWNVDRDVRKSAVECWSILKSINESAELVEVKYDVTFSFNKKNQHLVEYLYLRLASHGIRSFMLSLANNGVPSINMINILKRSEYFIPVLSSGYPSDNKCLTELRAAKEQLLPGRVLPLFVEGSPEDWMTDEVTYLCQLVDRSTNVFDLSEVSDEIASRTENSQFDSRIVEAIGAFVYSLKKTVNSNLIV